VAGCPAGSTRETVDRAGRRAEAFTLRSAHGGLRNDLTLAGDPATGRILAEVIG
jgi:hypothetical protein